MFWTKAEQVVERALENGSLLPITTEATAIVENGIEFLGHVVTNNAAKKFTSAKKQDNPFLPYEEDMYVADAGKGHVCLLNKYPVLNPHLLICSREFISQTAPLELQDFAAWIMGFDHDEVLGFYNGGTMAGASQSHRHMQLVKTAIPLEDAILSHSLPFEHRLYRFDSLNSERLYLCYLAGLKELGLSGMQGLTDESQCKPYNLILTKKWMLLVPRVTNNIHGVFANGINYSGRFLVKQPEQLAWLQQYGIMRFLGECSQAELAR